MCQRLWSASLRLQEAERDFLSLWFEASIGGLLITYMELIIIRAAMNLSVDGFYYDYV